MGPVSGCAHKMLIGNLLLYKLVTLLRISVLNVFIVRPPVAALRQLLINHMDGRMEDVDRDGERGKVQQHERRAGSLQGSEDRSVENGAERPETEHVTTENRHELPSADTGFFETSEDCGEEIR